MYGMIDGVTMSEELENAIGKMIDSRINVVLAENADLKRRLAEAEAPTTDTCRCGHHYMAHHHAGCEECGCLKYATGPTPAPAPPEKSPGTVAAEKMWTLYRTNDGDAVLWVHHSDYSGQQLHDSRDHAMYLRGIREVTAAAIDEHRADAARDAEQRGYIRGIEAARKLIMASTILGPWDKGDMLKALRGKAVTP